MEQNLLSGALRRLAAASPKEAPPEIQNNLRHAFRQVRAQRRRTRWFEIAAIAACWLAVLTAGTAGQWHLANHGKRAINAVATAKAQPAATPDDIRKVSASADLQSAAGAALDSAPISLDAQSFVPLPSFNPAVPVGDTQILRLQMPASALELVGIPVSGEASDQPILADVLVAQDGRPYAVRLASGQQ